MLEVDLLDLLMCMRPQIQVERDGAIGDDVDDGGVPVIQVPSENCSKAREEATHSGERKLIPKNSKIVSNPVKLINSAFVLNIPARISYPPTEK